MTETAYREPDPSLVTITHITYALHALGLVIGAFGASTVAGAFLFGWPSMIAVIINYVKRGDARGTWLESHFTWQINTFWAALAMACVVFLMGLLLVVVLVGFAIWAIGFFALGCWAVYRIASGWLKLNDRRACSGTPCNCCDASDASITGIETTRYTQRR